MVLRYAQHFVFLVICVFAVGWDTMPHMDTIKNLSNQLDAVLAHFRDELFSIRGSRPSPVLVEDIVVEYYETKTPIKQLGSINVIPPREIQVQVWDANVVKAVEKAISEKLSINASSDGNTIHANLPQLTQERRDELIKVVKAKAEDARIKSRTLRDDAKKDIESQEKGGDITQDDKSSLMDELKKEMDAFNKTVEDAVERKINEINE